jgi:hypothetical protein
MRKGKGGMKKCIQYFGWETEGRRLLGKPGRKWEDDIKTYL